MQGWTYKGFTGMGGNVTPLFKEGGAGVAIVAGSARPVFDEVKAVLAVHPDATIFAVNDVGLYLPTLHHWCSMHHERLKWWDLCRRSRHNEDAAEFEAFLLHAQGKGPKPYYTHSILEPDRYDYHWAALEPGYGLSGSFAAAVAYLMGHDQIILCGCPGGRAARFFDPEEGKRWNNPEDSYTDAGFMTQLESDARHRPEFHARLRSMSGFTADYFGRPEEVSHVVCQ